MLKSFFPLLIFLHHSRGFGNMEILGCSFRLTGVGHDQPQRASEGCDTPTRGETWKWKWREVGQGRWEETYTKTSKLYKTMIVLVDGQKDQTVDSFWWMVDFFW